MYSAYELILTLPANQTKVTDKKIKVKNLLLVAIEGEVYDLVYSTPSGRQVKYTPIFGFGTTTKGALTVDSSESIDRRVYVLIKQ